MITNLPERLTGLDLTVQVVTNLPDRLTSRDDQELARAADQPLFVQVVTSFPERLTSRGDHELALTAYRPGFDCTSGLELSRAAYQPR